MKRSSLLNISYRILALAIIPWLAACGALSQPVPSAVPPVSLGIDDGSGTLKDSADSEDLSSSTQNSTSQTEIAPDKRETQLVEGRTFAYLQDDRLYIRPFHGAGEALLLESCPQPDCLIQYPKWSPSGQLLMYYIHDWPAGITEIRLADRRGEVQTVAEDVAPMRPAAWSPDGSQIAYIRGTDRWTTPASDSEAPLNFNEIWTISLSPDGFLGEGKLVGEVLLPDNGCGGGGRSQSEELYEREGGTAYGYQMGRTEWTTQNVLLYTTNCTNTGIGRFDLTGGNQLEGYEQPLRGLVLTPGRNRWIAVSDESSEPSLATGDPISNQVELIRVSAPVELVFVGMDSGDIYFTSRQRTGGEDLSDSVTGGPLVPNFNFYESSLWKIQTDGSGEELLWESADHAYASLFEGPDGSLLFVKVENDTALYQVALDNSVPQNEWLDYLPRRHIHRIPAPGEAPTTWLENAGLLTLSP